MLGADVSAADSGAAFPDGPAESAASARAIRPTSSPSCASRRRLSASPSSVTRPGGAATSSDSAASRSLAAGIDENADARIVDPRRDDVDQCGRRQHQCGQPPRGGAEPVEPIEHLVERDPIVRADIEHHARGAPIEPIERGGQGPARDDAPAGARDGVRQGFTPLRLVAEQQDARRMQPDIGNVVSQSAHATLQSISVSYDIGTKEGHIKHISGTDEIPVRSRMSAYPRPGIGDLGDHLARLDDRFRIRLGRAHADQAPRLAIDRRQPAGDLAPLPVI